MATLDGSSSRPFNSTFTLSTPQPSRKSWLWRRGRMMCQSRRSFRQRPATPLARFRRPPKRQIYPSGTDLPPKNYKTPCDRSQTSPGIHRSITRISAFAIYAPGHAPCLSWAESRTYSTWQTLPKHPDRPQDASSCVSKMIRGQSQYFSNLVNKDSDMRLTLQGPIVVFCPAAESSLGVARFCVDQP